MTSDEFAQLKAESERLLDEAISVCMRASVVEQQFPAPTLRSLGWTVSYKKKNGRRLGWCRPSDKHVAILLSPTSTLLDALETVRHEFAHAVQYTYWLESQPHGVEWKACAVALGAASKAKRKATEVEKEELLAKVRWHMRHKITGEVFGRFIRQPRKRNLSRVYIKNRKVETLGQLEIVPIGAPLTVVVQQSNPVPAQPAVIEPLLTLDFPVPQIVPAICYIIGDTFPNRRFFFGAGLVWDGQRRGWRGTSIQIAAMGRIPYGCKVVAA